MPWLMISKCYEEILEDPSLWWLFPEEEWKSICKLPFLGTLQFWIVIRETVHLSVIPINVGIGQSGVHLKQQPENEWWDHPYGSFGNQWGGRGKSGHGDCLLSPWPGIGGVIGNTLHLMSVRLSWTKHSSSENICQLTIPPMGVFQLPLSGCNCSFIGCGNHPIPLRSVVPLVAVPLFPNTSCLAM